MWAPNNMYGGAFYDNAYGRNAMGRGNAVNANQQNACYWPAYKPTYNNSYAQAQMQPPSQQYSSLDQMRRLSVPADQNAAYASLRRQGADEGNSFRVPYGSIPTESPAPELSVSPAQKGGESSLYSAGRIYASRQGEAPSRSHTPLQARPPMQSSSSTAQLHVPSDNYSSASLYPERPHTAGPRLQQSYAFQRSDSMFGFGMPTYPMQATSMYGSQMPQYAPLTRAPSLVGMQRYDSVRDDDNTAGLSQQCYSLSRIDSEFDSRQCGSFHQASDLKRQISAFAGDSGSGLYGQGGGNINSSLYRGYSFGGNAGGGGGSVGISQYGSLYGQALQRGGPGSFYSAVSDTYPQTHSASAGDGEMRRLSSAVVNAEEKAAEDSESASPCSAPPSASPAMSFENDGESNTSESPQPYGEYDMPAVSRPRARPATSGSGTGRGLYAGSLRGDINGKPVTSVAQRPQTCAPAPVPAAAALSPPRASLAQQKAPPPTPQQVYNHASGTTTPLQGDQEEGMQRLRRGASAPVTSTRTAPQPTDASVRVAVQRVQLTGRYMNRRQRTSPSTIGRRRGTGAGLKFSGAEFV